MKTQKNVTNLLSNISKTLDILERRDFNEIKRNVILFNKVKDDIIRNVKKYIMYENHQLDFNAEDVRSLGDALLDVETLVIKPRYSNLYKTICKNKPIEIQHFNEMCYKVSDRFYFDKYIRPIGNDLSFFALVLWLWSESEYKKPIMDQLAACIKDLI